jgi:hypothetical protein
MRSLVYALREMATWRERAGFLRVWVRWLFWSVLRCVSAVDWWRVWRRFFRSQFGAGLLQIALGLVFVGLLQVAACLAS